MQDRYGKDVAAQPPVFPPVSPPTAPTPGIPPTAFNPGTILSLLPWLIDILAKLSPSERQSIIDMLLKLWRGFSPAERLELEMKLHQHGIAITLPKE